MDSLTDLFQYRAESNAPTQTSPSPSTVDPLLTASAGEAVTAAENNLIQDYQNLSAGSFIDKYGVDTYKSLLGQTSQAMDALRANRLASSGSLSDTAGDTVKNVITGALGGLIDTGAFVSGMTPLNPLTESLSRTSDKVRKFGESLGSASERGARDFYNFKQKALNNRINREYEEDIASGKGTMEAELARIGKQFAGSVGNSFESGQALELASSGLGSLLTGGVVSKGISLTAKAGKTVMPGIAKGIDAFAKENAVAKKIIDNTPWMASMGMQEGGGAYSQQLLEGLDMSIEDLRAKSPQFNEAVKHYVEQGIPLPEAEVKAKEDMAFAAAREASLETATAAFLANYMTAPLAKLARGDKMLSKYIGEALGEPVEEGITEGLGQIAGNKATRDYLDNTQSLWEDVGESAAQGAVGGLGIVGARAAAQAPAIADATLRYGAEGVGLGFEQVGKAREALHERKTSPKASLKNIDTFTSHSNKHAEFISDDQMREAYKGISNRLNGYADKAFGPIDPETGNRTGEFNLSEATEAFFEANDDREDLDSISSDSTFRNNRLFKRSQNKGSLALEGIQKAILNKTEAEVTSARKAYKNDPSTLGNLIEAEASLLAQTSVINPTQAKEYWSNLDPEIQDNLKEYSLSGTKANKAFTSFIRSVGRLNNTSDASITEDGSDESIDTPNTEESGKFADTTIEAPEAPATTPITGKGKHHWEDTNVNEAYVGGEGFKYAKGKLTRPGTASTQWNGEEIASIKDTSGNQAVGKFYSANGSEYVFTNEGTTRRIKYADPTTEGNDQGVQDWKDTYFLDTKDPLYKDLFGNTNFTENKDLFKNLRVDPSTRKIIFDDPETGETRPLMLSDVTPETETLDQDHDFTLPASRGEPKVGNTLIEFEFGDNDEILNSRASGGIAYIEPINGSSGNTDSSSKQELPKKKKNKKKPVVPTVTTDDVPSILERTQRYKKIEATPEDTMSVGGGEGLDCKYSLSTRRIFANTADGEFEVLLSKQEADKLNELQNKLKTASEDQIAAVWDEILEFLGEFYNEFADAYEKAVNEADKRDAVSFSPAVLEKDNKYLEDGQILDYDTDAVQKSFADNFGKAIGDAYHAVKRPFHLWNNKSQTPSETIRSLISNSDKLLEYLRANKFTDSEPIYKTLYTKNGRLDTRVDVDTTYVSANDTLANQLATYLNPEGTFMKNFKDAITTSLSKTTRGGALRKEFYSKDLDNRLNLLSVAGLQWLGALSSYAHNLTEDELRELGVDPELQDEDWNSFREVVEEKAMQNLATTIRKFLGISPKSTTSISESEDFINNLALDVASAMVQAGMVERSTKDYVANLDADGNAVNASISLLAPSEQYKYILRPRTNILETLINPKMTHTWSTHPVEAKTTIAHTSDPVTSNIKKTIQRANNTPYYFNTTYGSFLTAIGGMDGYFELNGPRPTKANRHLFNLVDYVSRQGKEISKRLGFDLLNEVLNGTKGTNLEDIAIHFSNVSMKNSRVMQEGSATPQGNKLVRELFQALDSNTQDLTTEKNKTSWNITLAQKLGVNVGKTDYALYKDSVAEAVEYVKGLTEYSETIDKILNSDASQVGSVKDTDETKATRESFLSLVRDFNKKFKNKGLSIKDDEGFNALLEMFKYAKAEKAGTLNEFPSRIFIETDGIADGPTTMNALYSKAVGRLTSNSVKGMFMGGIMLGVDIASQDIMSNVENEATNLIGTDGKDIHNLVANKNASRYVLGRLVELNKTLKNPTSPDAAQAALAKKALKAGLTVWKAMGKVSGNIDAVMHLDEMPENPSELLKFDLFVSKKGTTYVGYGAGSITNLRKQIQLGLRDMYSSMSESAKTLYAGKESPMVQALRKFKDAIQNERVYVIDTETTADENGPDPVKDQAVQVSIRILDKGKLQKKVHTFWIRNDSDRTIPEMLGDKPNPTIKGYAEAERKGKLLSKEEAYRQINELVKDGKVLGHNIRAFDSVLMNMNSDGKFDKSGDDVIDTLELARHIFKYRSNKLEDLAKAENIQLDEEGKTHDASVDTELTAKLALDLLKNVDSKIKEYTPAKATKASAADINGVPLSALMSAFSDLFKINYNYEDYYTESSENQEDLNNKYSMSFGKNIPQGNDLNTQWTIRNDGTMSKRVDGKTVYPSDFRNFQLKSNGLSHIVGVLNEVLGVPLHAAVTSAIGNDAIRAGKVPASVMGIANIVSEAEEFGVVGLDAEQFNDLTYQELYELKKNISANNRVNLPGGASYKVEKTRKVTRGTKYTDPSSGISYSPTAIMLDSASVSGGPLGVQASGDATTASRISQLAEGKFNYNPVYDGFYTTFELLDTMGKIANTAYSYALDQKVMTSLFNKMSYIDKKLAKLYYPNNTLAPMEALSKTITNLCQGKDPRGEKLKFASKEAEEAFIQSTTKEFFRYVDSFHNSDVFVESLFEARKIKENGLNSGYSAAARSAIRKGEVPQAVESAVKKLYRHLGAMSLIETVNNEVISRIPKKIQHMSGGYGAYTSGKPLTVKEAEDLLAKANKGSVKFADWSDLISAYISTKSNYLLNNKYGQENRFKPYLRDALFNMGLGNGNNVAKVINDQKLIDELDKAFGYNTFNPAKFYPANSNKGYRTINMGEVRSFLFNKSKSVNPMYKNIFKRVANNIPEDSKIILTKDPNNLPADLKSVWYSKVADKANQTGLFTYVKGKPVMIVISNTADLSMSSLNQETVLHECIHAVISRTLTQYASEKNLPANKRKLNEQTTKAIENLEMLLEDFQKDYADGKLYNFPKEVHRLAEILSNYADPVVRLDESMAYILSRDDLFTALSNYQPSNASAHLKRALRLVKKVQAAAKFAWKKILNIITGSPMDNVLEWKDVKKQFEAMSDNFINSYGMNTLVVLNSIDKYGNDGGKYSKALINSDISRASLATREGSLFHKLDGNFDHALKARIMGSATFKELAKGNLSALIDSRDASTAEAADEHKRILKYTHSIRDNLRNYTSKAKKVAKRITYFRYPGILSQKDRYNLTVSKNAALKHLTPTSFVADPATATQEDYEVSKHLYDLISGKIPLTDLANEDKPKYLQPKFEDTALFYALATLDPVVNRAISKIDLKIKDPTKPNKFTTISDYMNSWTEYVADNWKKSELDSKTPLEVLDASYSNTEKMLEEKESNYEKLERKLDDVSSSIISSLFKGLGAIGLMDKGMAKRLANYEANPLLISTFVNEHLRHFLNKRVTPALASFTREIYGRVPSNTEDEVFLKQLKGFVDKERLRNLKELPERMLNAFKEKLDRKDKHFLHRTIARNDLTCFDFNEIKDLILDPSKLDQSIASLEESIEGFSEYGHGYVSKAKQLADYISGSRKPGHNLLTNAVAIARNLGTEQPLLNISEDSEIVKNIDKLTSLYALKNLSKGDMKKLAHYFSKESKGIEEIFNQIKSTLEFEAIRTEGEPAESIHNRLKGWFPSGDQPKGLYRIVPRSEAKLWKSKGYKILGKYSPSSLDDSQAMIRVFTSNPQDQSYQEGILQGINSTYYGYQYQNGTRGEAIGTRIANVSVATRIANNFHSEEEGNEVIPLYSSTGQLIGFERSIPPEDRHYIDQDNDIFSGLAQYRTHQGREDISSIINPLGIELAKKQWDRAKDTDERKEFIDAFQSKDKSIQRAVSRLNPDTVRAINKAFGGNHFYVKKDILWTYIGYERPSITDVWDGKFFIPEKAQSIIANTLDLFVPDGKARYYISNFEKLWMGLVGFTRDTIIIRSGIVPFINAVSNIFVMHLTLGIPLNKIYELYKENLIYTKTYERLTKENRQLEYDLANTTDTKEIEKIQEKIKRNREEYESLPIYRLLKEGEYATISDEGTTFDEIELTKQKIDDVLNTATDKMPKFGYLRKGTREVLMLKGSQSYNTMLEFTNLGDWLAKATTYRYLTEGKLQMNHDAARNIASILFVDFDQFVGRERDWTNRIGLTWFMTYKYRMIPAALLSILMNPSRVILGTAFSSMFNFLGTPLTEMLPTKLITGDIAYSMGLDMIFRGLGMHPGAVVTNAIVK